MTHQELLRLSLAQAQVLIAGKEVTPLELVDAYLSRIEETEAKFRSFAEVYADAARSSARALTEMQAAGRFLGPLHGIPVSLKDNINVKGLRTTACSQVYRDNYPTEDAVVVRRLKAAGAVIIGKTVMHEFAQGATTDSPMFGAAHNPWDPARFCCGSSGGSAASVANATSLASLGTDTGGSIRLPSGVCGLVGMRPTIGRVSLNGIVPLAWSLDACGPITRSIRDNALMLGVLAGEEPGDPSTAKRPGDDFSRTIDRGVKGLRIGILPEVLFQKDQPAVVAAVQRALETFRSLGAEIVKCRVDRLELMPKAWSAVCYVEATSFHQKNLRTCPLDYGDDVRVLFQAGEFISGTTYVHAQRYRRWLREQFRTLFREQVDLLLFPTLPFTAVPIGDYELIIHGVKENVLPLSGTYVCYAPTTGLPALTLPCGLDERGLPVGLQLLGDAFREDVCYQAGAAFESVFHLYDRLPGIRPESCC